MLESSGFLANVRVEARAGRPALCCDIRYDERGEPLIAGIRRSGVTATLLEDIDQLAQLVVGEAVPGEDVILAMSGRDFHGIHDQMLSLLKERAARRRS